MQRAKPGDLLQPSLLDRLIDRHPDQRTESHAERVFSFDQWYAAVVRDLSWLLSTGCMEQTTDLSAFPHAAKSVLNYGWLNLAGEDYKEYDVDQLARRMRTAILDFEPRIDRDSLVVEPAEDQQGDGYVSFQIEGNLAGHQAPVRLIIRTRLDRETGVVDVPEGAD